MARALLAALSLLGLWAAVTMSGAYYGWWRGPARLVPARLCAARAGGCMDILASRYARVFGPPNSALGAAYYAALLALAMSGFDLVPAVLWAPLLWMAWGVVLLSIFLAWSLLFRLRTGCPICFLSHALNLAIAILLTFSPALRPA